MEVTRQMSPVRSSLVVVIGTTTLLNSSLILNSLLATDVRNGLRTLCRFPGEDGPHQIARIDGGGGQWPGETLDGSQLPGRSALPFAPEADKSSDRPCPLTKLIPVSRKSVFCFR